MAFDFIRLANGKKFHYLSPKPSDFDIEAIAHSLSQQCRYVGHTSKFYSIAEHASRVCDIMPDGEELEGLGHDNVEFVLGDVNTILKNLLPLYREMEVKNEAIMAKKFKMKFPFPASVKIADMTMLVTEMRDLMPGKDYKAFPFAPLPGIIKPWSPEKAKREYLKRYEKYRRV